MPELKSGTPLVVDMSSTLLSRPIDVSKFGLIYGGAQKNVGPAGLTLVIVREDLLGHARPGTPSFMDYSAMAKEGSMLNTPPTYAWYLAGLVFQWLKRQGGLKAMGEINRRKAELLYSAIDTSSFYKNPVAHDARSWMNVPFTLARAGAGQDVHRRSEGRRTGDVGRPPLGRWHARQHLQRHAAGWRGSARELHEGIRAQARVMRGCRRAAASTLAPDDVRPSWRGLRPCSEF